MRSFLRGFQQRVAAAIEQACAENPCIAKDRIAESIVKAYLQAKMAQAEISPTLYRIAMELDARELIELATRRSANAIEAMLSTSNGRFTNPGLLAQTLTAALYGTVPAFCHRVLSAADGAEAERQLTIMFRSYLIAHRSGIADATP